MADQNDPFAAYQTPKVGTATDPFAAFQSPKSNTTGTGAGWNEQPNGPGEFLSTVANGITGIPKSLLQTGKGMLTHPLDTLGSMAHGIANAPDEMANDFMTGHGGRAVGNAALLAAPLLLHGLGSMAEAPAEPLVKSALSLPGKAEAFGATPAKAVLEETSGVRPSTIAASGRSKMGHLMPQMEAAVSKATNPVDLSPARGLVTNAQDLAAKQGNKLVHGQIQPMGEALAGNRVTGAPYPTAIAPREALDLKRGFGDEFANYNPDVHDSTNALAKNVYRNLAQQIHEAAPGSQEIDQRIQSLIPAVNRAEAVSRGAGAGQRLLDRVARPTGGLFPLLFGLHEGGIPGMMATMAGQETLSSPTFKMLAARGLYGGGKGLQMAGEAARPVTAVSPLTWKQKPEQ